MFNFIVSNARKPKSFFGRIFISSMNKGHKPLHLWGLSLFGIGKANNILDIGCGGGTVISELLKNAPSSKVYGIDYSDLSVKKSSQLNSKEIKNGRCNIVKADVSKIPHEDLKFNIITAIETIYFWPDINKSFTEIYRVLAKDGIFVVCNEASCYKDAEKYAKLLNMNVYTPEEIENIMKLAGFSNVDIYRHPNKIWICVIGHK